MGQPEIVTVLGGLLVFCICDGFAEEFIGCCITFRNVYLEVHTPKHGKIRKALGIRRHPVTFETSLKPLVQYMSYIHLYPYGKK